MFAIKARVKPCNSLNFFVSDGILTIIRLPSLSINNSGLKLSDNSPNLPLTLTSLELVILISTSSGILIGFLPICYIFYPFLPNMT
jgi:hypothetical protein